MEYLRTLGAVLLSLVAIVVGLSIAFLAPQLFLLFLLLALVIYLSRR